MYEGTMAMKSTQLRAFLQKSRSDGVQSMRTTNSTVKIMTHTVSMREMSTSCHSPGWWRLVTVSKMSASVLVMMTRKMRVFGTGWFSEKSQRRERRPISPGGCGLLLSDCCANEEASAREGGAFPVTVPLTRLVRRSAVEVMLCRLSLLRSPLMSGRPREIMYQCTCQCRVVLRFTQAAFEKRLLRKNSESGPLRGRDIAATFTVIVPLRRRPGGWAPPAAAAATTMLAAGARSCCSAHRDESGFITRPEGVSLVPPVSVSNEVDCDSVVSSCAVVAISARHDACRHEGRGHLRDGARHATNHATNSGTTNGRCQRDVRHFCNIVS